MAESSPSESAGPAQDGTLVLYQFPRGPYAPNMSPFCIKLETFLRMAKIPYKSVFTYKMGPKGKLPWVEYEGAKLADSEFIIQHLCERHQLNFDGGLTPKQRGISRAIQKMVDEHTYWLMVLERWVIHKADTAKTLTKLPGLVLWMLVRKVRNKAFEQGLGRHTPDQLEQLLDQDLAALSDLLGEDQFVHGDEPTLVDCALFGQLSQFRWHVPDSVKAKHDLNDKFANLGQYCDRMKERFWPDWDDCITHGFTKAPAKQPK